MVSHNACNRHSSQWEVLAPATVGEGPGSSVGLRVCRRLGAVFVTSLVGYEVRDKTVQGRKGLFSLTLARGTVHPGTEVMVAAVRRQLVTLYLEAGGGQGWPQPTSSPICSPGSQVMK